MAPRKMSPVHRLSQPYIWPTPTGKDFNSCKNNLGNKVVKTTGQKPTGHPQAHTSNFRFSISHLLRSVLLILKMLSLYRKISVIFLPYPQRYTSPSLVHTEPAFSKLPLHSLAPLFALTLELGNS